MKTILNLSLTALMFLCIVSCNTKNTIFSETDVNQKAYEDKITQTNHNLFTAWNTANPSLMKANLGDTFKRKQNGVLNATTPDEFLNIMKMYVKAIPDIKFTYELIDVKGNQTFSKWTAKGTNTGPFGDMAATGKPSITHGFTVLTFDKDGKTIMEEAYFDQLSYLEAWGYEIAPPSSK